MNNNPQMSVVACDVWAKAKIEEFFYSEWQKRTDATDCDLKLLLDERYSRVITFNYLLSRLPIRRALLDALLEDGGLLSYWEASGEIVKSLTDGDFNLLAMKEGFHVFGDNTAYYAYHVLRYSHSKPDLECIKKLGRMNNSARIKSQKDGGKLHRMASKYLQAQ